MLEVCPFQRCFSIFKPARAHQSFIGFEFLTSSSVTRWKKLSAFKGLMWLDTMFAFRDSLYLDASWSRNLILSEKHPYSSSETSVWRHVSTRARNGEQQFQNSAYHTFQGKFPWTTAGSTTVHIILSDIGSPGPAVSPGQFLGIGSFSLF